MIHDYLELGGLEIANLDRSLTYAQLFRGPGTTFGKPRNQALYPHILSPGPYTTPADDNAPWYDPNIPESAGFGGVLMTNLDTPTPWETRPVYTGVSGGGSVGPLRAGPQRVEVLAWLVGCDEPSLVYGFEWLNRALIGGHYDCDIRPGEARSLRAFSGKPRCSCCLGDTPGIHVARYMRTLPNVSVMAMPEVVDTWKRLGCVLGYQVRFTLVSTSSFSYGEVMETLVGAPTDMQGPFNVSLPDCAQPETEFSFTPRCFATALTSTTTVNTNCWCQPLSVFRSCHTLDNPESDRAVPHLEIDTPAAAGGITESSNIRVVFYENRPGDPTLDCGVNESVDWWECNRKMAVLEVPVLPQQSKFVFDGQTGRTRIETADGQVHTRGVVQGENGLPLSVPVMRPCSEMHVVVETDCEATIPGTTWTLGSSTQFVHGGA